MVEHRVLTDEELEEHDRQDDCATAAILRQAIIDEAMEVLFADSLDGLADEEILSLLCDQVIGEDGNSS